MEGNPRMIKQVKRSWENRAFLECLKAISVGGRQIRMYENIFQLQNDLSYGPKGNTETDW